MTTFQPHIWHPDDRIEVPVRVTRIEDGRIGYGEWGDPRYAALPGELVTRELLDLNLHTEDDWDAAAVLRFVDTYGAIEPLDDVERALALSRPRKWEDFLDERTFPFDVLFEPLRDVAQLARHWIAYKSGGNVLDVWYPDGIDPDAFDADVIAEEIETCHHRFALGVEERTANTRVRFTVGTSWGTSLGLPAPDLIDALSIQLLGLCFLHKDHRLPLLDCANENCHYSFFRQRGGKLQHRNTGSKYCSRACAQAVAARASRRRRKEAEL